MEERSQRAKIGSSGRRWQVVPALGGVGLLIAMVLVAQTPEPPAPLLTATVVAETIVTPSISTQPTPNNPISSLPTVDLADQQLLLVDVNDELKLWNGTGLVQARGRIEHFFSTNNEDLTIDWQREMLFIRSFYWLEARSLRDNRRLWQLPITEREADVETKILDVVSDPFNQLVWLLEKQRATDPFQPATVRLRGLDSRSGLELRRYQAPLLNDQPQVLPTVNGPWLLADGQLWPFDPTSKAFGEPLLDKLEFAQVAPDGKRALVFGDGMLTELDLIKQQTFSQTELTNLPQVSSIECIIASPNLGYVVIIGTIFEESDLSQQIMAYAREGKPIGSWQRQLLAYSTHGVETDISDRIHFLDDQRLVLLHRTGVLEIIDLTTNSKQAISLRADDNLAERLEHWDGFALIPNLTPQALIENPELASLDSTTGFFDPPFESDIDVPLAPTADPQPLGLAIVRDQVLKLWDDGRIKTIDQSSNYSIIRNNAPPLFVDRAGTDLAFFDPTNQITFTVALEPAEAKSLSDFAGISAPDKQSVAFCYSYHLDASADSRVNRCRELDLQTGQTKLFAELPAATLLTPIYWDGRQLTIVGKTYREAKQADEYLVWQTLADDRTQGQMLLQALDLKQLWYVVGSPTVICQSTADEIYSYNVLEQTSHLLTQGVFNHSLRVDLAPNGQSVALLEREYPLKYGKLRMFDTATGAELWHDTSINYQFGDWSGDSQFYLTKRYQTINSIVNTYTRQGKIGHSLLVADGFSDSTPDWSGQRIVLEMYNELFLLERVNEHWLPLRKFSGLQAISDRSFPLTMAYVYPQP
ncbi:hypothetical protein [Herpetosiphon gulosus]|uniref:Uncharacterized protein n=1 Tax=Herpetosiphon gulosus TaxID=1973496 RepID=A0ABP9X6Q4_9CHLR